MIGNNDELWIWKEDIMAFFHVPLKPFLIKDSGVKSFWSIQLSLSNPFHAAHDTSQKKCYGLIKGWVFEKISERKVPCLQRVNTYSSMWLAFQQHNIHNWVSVKQKKKDMKMTVFWVVVQCITVMFTNLTELTVASIMRLPWELEIPPRRKADWTGDKWMTWRKPKNSKNLKENGITTDRKLGSKEWEQL
jgi:hypothetical protein